MQGGRQEGRQEGRHAGRQEGSRRKKGMHDGHVRPPIPTTSSCVRTVLVLVILLARRVRYGSVPCRLPIVDRTVRVPYEQQHGTGLFPDGRRTDARTPEGTS